MSDVNSNIKYIKGVSQYRVTSDDEILNVDTSDGAITIVLPNIKAWQLLFSKPKKVITVNDYSRTASTNSITIIANNNNINGLPSLILDADGDSSTFSPVDNNEWFGDKQPSGGGGGSQTLQDVVDLDPYLSGAIYSPDNNTTISIGNYNLGLSTDGFLNLDGNIVNINGVQAATLNDIKTKYKETFTYNGIALTLSNTCSFMYSLNWGNLALNEGVDYSFSGTTLTILNSNINNGDLLYAIYE